MKRVVAYRPGIVTPEPEIKKEKKVEAVTIKKEDGISETIDLPKLLDIQKEKSVKIIRWIKEHEEFKWGVMCTKLGMDRGNFQRLIKNKVPTIKPELIPKIEDFLKSYGYAK